MFKVSQSPTYTAPVHVAVPSDGGRVQKFVFTAIFHRLPQTEIDDLVKGINAPDPILQLAGNTDAEVVQKLYDDDIVHRVLAGWGNDVVDDDNQPLEFNDANLAALLQIHPTRRSIVAAYFDSMKGARAKN